METGEKGARQKRARKVKRLKGQGKEYKGKRAKDGKQEKVKAGKGATQNRARKVKREKGLGKRGKVQGQGTENTKRETGAKEKGKQRAI